MFRHLRDLFQVDPADYMLAICGNDALRELSSPGKSGSFFYLTQDDRFMIKTVKKSEVKVCCLILDLLMLEILKIDSIYDYEDIYYAILYISSDGRSTWIEPLLLGQLSLISKFGELFCSGAYKDASKLLPARLQL